MGVFVAEKTDIELITLARNGDKNAFGLLAQRYQIPVQRFAVRLTAGDNNASDLAQEAMLEAYRSLGNLRNPERFKSWLYGIMLNVYRSSLRDRKIAFFSLEAIIQGLHFFPAPFSTPVLTPEKIAEENEQYQIVLGAVNALSPGDRDIILLFYYAQLSLLEIVKMMNLPAGTVKVRLHRARQRLKAVLEERYPEMLPQAKRRKKMVKVTIADVIKVEKKDGQEQATENCIIVLHDEAGKRLMPIWIGAFEAESIAAGLGDLATPRPMTHNFYSGLLQSIDARVEEVRVVSLKKGTFYAIVRMRCGKKTNEIDARPSDAIALAVLNDSPIFVDEGVLEAAGIKIPEKVKELSPTRRGLEKIIKAMEERMRLYKVQADQQLKKYQGKSKEEIAREREKFIASLYEK
jgi:RNA polymerase sigma factor (sigma-70 family)